MELKNVSMIEAKISKDVSFNYYDMVHHRNVSLSDDTVPHPDMRKAFNELKKHFEDAIAPETGIKESFVPTTITISESQDLFYLTIKGKFTTTHDDIINVSSGKISLEEDSDLSLVVGQVKFEMFQYFFKGKESQGSLEFDADQSDG